MNKMNAFMAVNMPKMADSIRGKTVTNCFTEDYSMDTFLVIQFSDETELRIRYDWIYEWGVVPTGKDADAT